MLTRLTSKVSQDIHAMKPLQRIKKSKPNRIGMADIQGGG